MTRLRVALVFAGVAIAAAAGGIYFSSWREASTLPFARAAKPKELPALQFEDASGRSRSLADFRGKLVLLNVWATWCAPCREEMPALDRLQARLGGPAFDVVALSVDQQGPDIARRFLGEIGVKSLDFYIDRSARAAFQLDAAGLPATLLIDRDGREIGRHLGAAKWDAPDVVADLQRRIAAGGVRSADGAKLYQQHCASCHGAKLEGQPNWRQRLPNGRMPAPPHDETGHTWHHPDEVLFGITKQGLVPPYAPAGYESDMPAFGGKLSDAEIRAVLAYIASSWTSPQVRQSRAEMLRNAPRR